jgi:hypothetical protein
VEGAVKGVGQLVVVVDPKEEGQVEKKVAFVGGENRVVNRHSGQRVDGVQQVVNKGVVLKELADRILRSAPGNEMVLRGQDDLVGDTSDAVNERSA